MKTLLDMTESNNGKKLTIEEVQRLVKMETIDDCKQYMKVMLMIRQVLHHLQR